MTDQHSAAPASGDRTLLAFAFFFASFAFLVLLLQGNVADFDIWHCTAMGASMWHTGTLFPRDVFAFTPVLDRMIHHEWGAGLVYYALLRWIGPEGLMLWKLLAAFGALGAGFAAARRNGASAVAILLMAPVVWWALLPAFWPVVRPHSFTYLFFAITLFLAEHARSGARWPFVAFPLLMLAWVQVHGGFLAGLGAWGVLGLAVLPDRRLFMHFLVAGLVALGLTFVNPYGWHYWPHHLAAIAHKRPAIPEWQPLPLLASDSFNGARALLLLSVGLIAAGWKRVPVHRGGLAFLVLTAFLMLRSRRHAPFFALTAALGVTPYLQALASRAAERLPDSLRRLPAPMAPLALHGLLAAWMAIAYVPTASWRVTAPRGLFPMHEADILAASRMRGNLVAPYHMGGYLLWRLHPNILISMDGRYEVAYPEPTHEMNLDFFFRRGDWQRIVRDYRVDFVILDLYFSPLRPEDLQPLGYRVVFRDEESTALLVREDRLAELIAAVPAPPASTVDPLNHAVAENWFRGGRYAPESAGPLLAPPLK